MGKLLSETELEDKLLKLISNAYWAGKDNRDFDVDDKQKETFLRILREQEYIRTEMAHRDGYTRGVSDFTRYYMNASIPAQRIPVMPHIAQDLIDNYKPHLNFVGIVKF